jgi:YHS domain-containing protein
MKTLLAISLIVTGLFFTAGCGSEKKPETSGQKDHPAVPANQQQVDTKQTMVQGTESATPEAGKGQTFCPVMWGNPINRNVFSDYGGKRVYFCCTECQAKFKDSPQLYIKKLEDKGVVLEKAPATTDTTSK